MTKSLLEQYPDICAELRDLNSMVMDSVSGSSPEPPYVKHTISMQGVPYTERRLQLERQKTEIEAFVASIPQSRLRRVATYRALKGMSWGEVAAKMGHRHSSDALRKQYEKIFE